MESLKRKLPDSYNDSKNQKKTERIIEQDFINYMSVPSLESMAIVNVAAGLCLESDIKGTIRQHSLVFDPIKVDSDSSICGDINNTEMYNQIEKNIFNKLSLLPLPNLLKDKVSDVVGPIIFQILKSVRTDHKDLENGIPIYWTSLGTIDRVKILEQLVDKEPDKFINSIYQSACTFCLEDSIPYLWAKLPEKIQNNYLCSEMIYTEYHDHLIAYWTSIATNRLPGLISKMKPSDHKDIYNCSHSVNKNMFTLALSEGNSLAVKYFWYKLTAEEISSNLSRWVNELVRSMKGNKTSYQSTNRYADVLFFLFSKMNDAEQQSEVFRKHISVILYSLFLTWPWQRFLLPTIRAMWNFLDERVYVQLLKKILYKTVEIGNKTADKLLRELWCDSPIHLKKYFIQYIANEWGRDLLKKVLRIKDVKTVNVILNVADIEVKKNIIFSVIVDRDLFLHMFPDNLPLFNILIAETISQESEIKEFKERIAVEHGKALCYKWIRCKDWQMVETFCNWVFTSEEQIGFFFKYDTLDKFQITYSLLHEGKYELLNRFLNLCFGSEQEIKRFKKDFATCNHKQIVQLGYYSDFCSFEKIVAWGLGSEQEINEFKSAILHSSEISDIIFRGIAFGPSGFIDKLISWCCRSNEEMKQFKAGFILSDKGVALLQRFVDEDEMLSFRIHLEWTRKFIKWFSPLEKELMTRLKEKITTSVNFRDKNTLGVNVLEIQKKDLFCLLDNHNYTVGEDESSDDDHDASNYEDAFVVLTEILNKVESGLLEESTP